MLETQQRGSENSLKNILSSTAKKVDTCAIHDQRVNHEYADLPVLNSLTEKKLLCIHEFSGPHVPSSVNKPVAIGMQV